MENPSVSRLAPVEFTVEKEGNVAFIIPPGEWVAGDDGETGFQEAIASLQKEGTIRVVVDLSGVNYMDSSALGQLVHGYSILKKGGGSLKLLKPSKRIIDLLSVTRLLAVFEVYQSRSDVPKG